MIGRVHGGRDKRDRDDADETPRQDAPASDVHIHDHGAARIPCSNERCTPVSDGPATEAGRDLASDLRGHRKHYHPDANEASQEASTLAAIRAIEAEAAAGPRSEGLRLRGEYAALSLPLGTTREAAQHERDTGLYYIDRILAASSSESEP